MDSIIEEKERWERYLKACNGKPNSIAKRRHEARIRHLENLRAATIRNLMESLGERAMV
jgi:hypothetical protein